MVRTELFIIMFFYLSSYGQSDKTLSKKLWAQIQGCYLMLIDEDGRVDYDELIDDSKNGYLKISGSFPTCGCNCINTVGAYRTTKVNEYVFLKKSTWGCSWKEEINASDNLSAIFPFDFETDGFFLKRLSKKKQRATFYIDIEIPRKGTDTKVVIKLIPLGLNVRSNKNIVFSHSQENSISNYSEVYSKIQEIAKKIQDKQTLEYLLKNQFENVSNVDKELVNNVIASNIKNKEGLVLVLQELKQTYDLYNQIKHQWLILGWNRAEKAFYIKERGKEPKRISFREFLRVGRFWSAIC